MQVKSLDHIHIYAADPEVSTEFYTHHFEAEVILRDTNAKGDIRIFLALGGQILVIGGFPHAVTPASPPKVADGAYHLGFGVAHFGFNVEDLDAAIAELSAGKVRLLSNPVHEPSGLSYAYIEAPDGVVIELTQYESAG